MEIKIYYKFNGQWHYHASAKKRKEAYAISAELLAKGYPIKWKEN